MAPNSTTFMHLGLPSSSAMSLAGTAMVLKLRAMASMQPSGYSSAPEAMVVDLMA